jgi:hypothetical protein
VETGLAILVGVSLALSDLELPKALRYMRALRRAVISYWYATLEDQAAAAIEAATATFYVNILDEAVFAPAKGELYRAHRAQDPLGRVVTGLELVRNCETHARVVADDLLVQRQLLSIPLQDGGTTFRSVFAWAEYDDLPSAYRELQSGATAGQSRARGEAQHGFRDAVQARHVIETLFDAISFFEALEPRLIGVEAPHLPWAYGEAYAQLPRTDITGDARTEWMLARPMGLDAYEVYLPDIVCRYTERRSAQWPAADANFKAQQRRARNAPPGTANREVLHVLTDGPEVVGYSGYGATAAGLRSSWVERRRQVWRDLRCGYRYYVVHHGAEIDLRPTGNQQVGASSPDSGRDLLATLPPVSSVALSRERLAMVEQYPDMYLEMRAAT